MLAKEFIVIEHHAIADCEVPLRQGIGELQIDIVVEDVPPLVGILLSGHEEVSLDAKHQGEAFGQEGCIQFEGVQWHGIGEDGVAGILVTAHDEQFCAQVVEGVEIPGPAHDLMRGG